MNTKNDSSSASVVWIRTGVAAGLGVCLVYPVLVFLHLPIPAVVVFAAAMGPLLGVASLGLGKLLQIPRPSIPAQLAMAFNFAAGALVSGMLLVQLAVKTRWHGPTISPDFIGIWLGLDVAWDVYLGVGTFLFALAMLKHPRFGLLFGVSGLLLATLLLALNIATFPTPPADAGFVDPSPFVGLWYVVVIVQIWRSLRWVKCSMDRTS